MATVTQIESTANQPSTPSSNFSLRIDKKKLSKSVARLLRQGLNQYQLLLNSKLITEVQIEFERWLELEHREITSQLRNIPSHAKQKWLEERFEVNERRRRENQPLRLLTDFLFQFGQIKIKKVEALTSANLKFRKAFAKVRGIGEREKLILNYADELGANPTQLKGDAYAFGRWFDEEAVLDRFNKRLGQTELILCFVFGRLGEVIDYIFQLAHQYHLESAGADEKANRESLHTRLAGIWKRLNIESRIHEALKYDGDDRVRVAVLRLLAMAAKRLPDDLGADLLDDRTLIFIHREAMENKSDVWSQCEALTILTELSFSRALPFLKQRLDRIGEGDDMFVRRHALKLIEQRLLLARQHGYEPAVDVPLAENEPSPFVRQKLAKVAFLSSHEDAIQTWRKLATSDPAEQVRAAALLAGIEVTTDLTMKMDYLHTIEESLRNDQSSFVVRTAFHCLVEMLKQQTNESETIQAYYHQRITPLIHDLESSHPQTPVRRWAAQTNEQIWALLDDQARQLIQQLRPRLQTTSPGRSCWLPRRMLAGIAPEKIGRIFAVLSQDDFGYDIHKGWFFCRIMRGPSFGFRLWRFIFEFKNTSTDKRQALRHTIGRISTATLRAPSQILGELSETKVPGEPLTIDDDGTWRPFLPLPDDFVSVLNLSWVVSRTVKFFTSQGVTSVTGPRRFVQKITAAWKLNFRFSKFADKRNWNNDTFPATEYIDALRGLGFKVEFSKHEVHEKSSKVPNDSSTKKPGDDSVACDVSVTSDDSVTRFFDPALIAVPLLVSSAESSIWSQIQRFSDYFGSAFENSLEQLVIFACAVLLLLIGKHFYANYTLRKARRNIGISIGGWGTRGKSGTERLKAALIGVMGHGLVSKTTGCEAMFIHANPHGEPLEIPLFRPYDKATIWEQRNLIRIASRMDPSVFLWECMALTPSYVNVLQRQWTCDDLGTITNTYPDHEDVQGPAGHNVAQTISGFVPLNSHLLSTEQVMRPYVTESCRLANSTFRGIGWLESGLITEDILERFPYKEHPDNIALVAAMGDELGCEYEYCLKAMADDLVPDLGVLKTHPISKLRTRQIEFTNGMSANERFGCMGNWRRLDFDKQDPWQAPTTWICGVVNNRADRVPRTKVFAKIVVEDINADRFFLIGSNLLGLQGFIEEAWEEKASSISLHDKNHKWNTSFALATLKQAAWNFRQPIEPAHIQAKLERMVDALSETVPDPIALSTDTISEHWDDPANLQSVLESASVTETLIKSVIEHQTQWLAALSEYESMHSLISESQVNLADSIERQFIELLKTWFDRKFVVVENYDATGEEVVGTLVDETPPGFLNRTMGLQNIKGTGLDFVYRFQAWDVCYEACLGAQYHQVQTVEKSLLALISMPEIGQLCQAQIREVINYGRSSQLYRRPEIQTLLAQLDKKLRDETGEEQPETVDRKQSKSGNGSRTELNAWIIDTAEQFLDAHDSIRRRKRADLIYKDLADERISRQRAVVELRKINKRQKGGWLVTKSAS